MAIAVALLLREDVAVGLIVLGGFLWLSGHRPKIGAVIAAVSFTCFVLVRFVIMEAAGAWPFHDSMFQQLEADGITGLSSVVRTMVTNPIYVLAKVGTADKVVYVLHVLVPLALLPTRRWYLWSAFIPGALLTLTVTDHAPVATYSYHYVMHWAPYLFLATALALASLRNAGPAGGARTHAALIAMCFATAALSYNYGLLPQRTGSFRAGGDLVEFTWTEADRQRRERLYGLIANIPKEASVAATEHAGPHVSSRLQIFTLRSGLHGAEYILMTKGDLADDRVRARVREAMLAGGYGVLARTGEFALLQKGHTNLANRRLLVEWGL